ncbi:putative O-methyltransferase YrrM [Paenibacillus shirakamiensis]|uniref:O-methyltransferase YrrM n=1 Tax=Paenibacillus shirakamiensis TaxID=1265935 RepID=A0ABS4JK17_9BACL|nr:O-methyltransferase [Paenibacillus shirakamiensis]MBP2001326.1 putative O-methyltransferase YrrM [Paenibacillus shirakamiensis]
MTTPEQYSEELYAEDEVLGRVKASIAAAGIQDVSIAPGYGRLLTLLVTTSCTTHALEIGALGGYSGICIARGLVPGGTITSLEISEDNARLAGHNMEEAGFGKNVNYMIGPALESLDQLQAEGKRFDFFFIDADKENYAHYLERAIQLANPGAIIAGDNTLLRGRTLNAEKNGPSVVAMRKFNEMIATDERLLSTFLPAFDGLALALVK